jgi:hypothetical protein
MSDWNKPNSSLQRATVEMPTEAETQNVYQPTKATGGERRSDEHATA